MARLFVAIRPTAPVREALSAAMGGVAGARWQYDEQLHLTLSFIGEADGRRQAALEQALEWVESEPFAAEVAGVGHFERKGAPAAIWAAVPLSPALAVLQQRVERACHLAGLATEKRTFRPHITLARLARSAGAAGEWLVRHGTLRAGPWSVTGFTLYESRLHPHGAAHEPLVDYEF